MSGAHRPEAGRRPLTLRDVLDLDTFEGALASCFAFSPAGDRLAFVVQRAASRGVRHQQPGLVGNERGELWLADLASREVRPLAAGVADGTGFCAPAWSPDGQSIAAAMIDEASVRPVVINAGSGQRRVLLEHNLALCFGARPCCWLDPDHLLCAVLPAGILPLAFGSEIRAPHRASGEWLKARAGREPTADILDVVPDAPRGPAFLDPEPTFVVVSLLDGSAGPLPDDAVTPEVGAFQRSHERLTLEEPDLIPPTTFSVWAIAVPLPAGGRLVAAHDATSRVACLIEDDVGSRVWIVEGDGTSPFLVFETNTHLRQVRAGTVMDLDYAAADGTRLTARLLLPPGHEKGDRKPAVVWAYPGTKPAPVIGRPFKLNDASPFNLHLLAAQGYVVIQPSMGLPEGDAPLDLMSLLAPTVEGAIEAAVALGHVDRDRVHALGQSLGGYAVMGLLATTDVFRSGIAMAGFCDLFSFYGAGDARFRYGDPAHLLFHDVLSPEKWCRLGGPPWREPERYARNSPLLAADRIRAPLLITQGDQDGVPMEQGEEMFRALRKLGRRVRFVRYWGEGHILSSPANVAHLWDQILGWMAAAEFVPAAELKTSRFF